MPPEKSPTPHEAAATSDRSGASRFSRPLPARRRHRAGTGRPRRCRAQPRRRPAPRAAATRAGRSPRPRRLAARSAGPRAGPSDVAASSAGAKRGSADRLLGLHATRRHRVGVGPRVGLEAQGRLRGIAAGGASVGRSVACGRARHVRRGGPARARSEDPAGPPARRRACRSGRSRSGTAPGSRARAPSA